MLGLDDAHDDGNDDDNNSRQSGAISVLELLLCLNTFCFVARDWRHASYRGNTSHGASSSSRLRTEDTTQSKP
jgi:hypothetical protein